MTQKLETQKLVPNANDFENIFMPGLAIDAVIFGFDANQLKILLLKYENTNLYALPVGFKKK